MGLGGLHGSEFDPKGLTANLLEVGYAYPETPARSTHLLAAEEHPLENATERPNGTTGTGLKIDTLDLPLGGLTNGHNYTILVAQIPRAGAVKHKGAIITYYHRYTKVIIKYLQDR